MLEAEKSRSPAERFFGGQQITRNAIRTKFKEDAGDLLAAHELFVSAIFLYLDRLGGMKWPEGLSQDLVDKTSQVAQLSMQFVHGIDICEVAIAEGLYGQAAALLRQQMEVVGAIHEVQAGKRTPKVTPKITTLSNELKRQYGELSEMTHAAVPKNLEHMYTKVNGNLVGAAIVPQYQKGVAISLYRISLSLLAHFIETQDTTIRKAYGDGLNEIESFYFEMALAAVDLANKAEGIALNSE